MRKSYKRQTQYMKHSGNVFGNDIYLYLYYFLIILKVRMATSRDILCVICEAQHITKHADHWCPECHGLDKNVCISYHDLYSDD
jgi:hypothetical protein